MISETNSITGEKRERLPYAELGQKMLEALGEKTCASGYNTIDPEYVGRYALMYGDINPDGTFN